MKLFTLAAAGLVAVSAVAATPAEAQWRDRDYGWRDGRGWNDGRGYRGRHYGYDRGRRYGYNRGGYGWRNRGRTTCRWVRGYYGPERRCYRIRW